MTKGLVILVSLVVAFLFTESWWGFVLMCGFFLLALYWK